MKKVLHSVVLLILSLSAAVAMNTEGLEEEHLLPYTRHLRGTTNAAGMEEAWETLDILETRQAALSEFLNEEDEEEAWNRDYPHSLYIAAFQSTDEEFTSRVAMLHKYKDVLFSRAGNTLILKTALQLTPVQIESGAATVERLDCNFFTTRMNEYDRALVVSRVLPLPFNEVNERFETVARYKNIPFMHDSDEEQIKDYEWIKIVAAALALTPEQIHAGMNAIQENSMRLFPPRMTPSTRIATIVGALAHSSEEIRYYLGQIAAAKEIFEGRALLAAECLDLASIIWQIQIDDIVGRLNIFHACAINLFTEDMDWRQRMAIIESTLLATPHEIQARLQTLIACKDSLLPQNMDTLDRVEAILKTLRSSPEKSQERAARAKTRKPLCTLQ